jgi:hypothetical protein
MKHLGIKSIACFFSCLTLFISCERYDSPTVEEKSEYYGLTKAELIRRVQPINLASLSKTEISYAVLSNVNELYGTNLILSEQIHAYAALEFDEILPQAVKDGVITNIEKDITMDFVSDYLEFNKTIALENMQLSMNGVTNEMALTRLSNLVEWYAHINFELYTPNADFNAKSCSWYRCALATTALTAAALAVAGGAVTISGAILAFLLFANASLAFTDQCIACQDK